MCRPGEPVELRLEPDNPADPLAIAVYSARDIQLGYLSAERCGRIGAMIRQGRQITSVFQHAAPWGAVIRAAFDGDVPFFPPPRDPADQLAEQDFWPDPEWPGE